MKMLRKSRSPVLLDYDDFLILNLSIASGYEGIGSLKNFLNISQKAMGIHLNRLKKYNLITIKKGTGEAFRERWVYPTTEGKKVFEVFKEGVKGESSKSSEFHQYLKLKFPIK